MEKLIPISIVGAKIITMGFRYKEDDEVPDFTAEVQLIDAHGKNVTSITVTSMSYYGSNSNCELSPNLVMLAAKVKRELNDVITVYMNSKQKILEGGSNV